MIHSSDLSEECKKRNKELEEKSYREIAMPFSTLAQGMQPHTNHISRIPSWLPIEEIATFLGIPKTHTDEQRYKVARKAISNVNNIYAERMEQPKVNAGKPCSGLLDMELEERDEFCCPCPCVIL